MLNFYKTVAVPTRVYGIENKATTKRIVIRIQAQEITFLERVNERSRRDGIRNESIRKKLQILNFHREIL